jgi:CRISPR-associated protein (TIGR02710 family)
MTTVDLPPDFVADVRRIVGEAPVDGLITMGTGQELTAAMLVAACQPARLAIIPTVGTEGFAERLQALLGSSVPWPELGPALGAIHPDDTNAIYRALHQVITAWPPGGRYLTDVTPGKKPMSVGVAKAATLLNLPTLYVNSQFVQNAVVPGSQRLIDLPDPYVVFGDLEAAEARRLFHAHDYTGAQRIFGDLSRRVPQPERMTYAVYADLARAYAAWDAFDLPLAERTMVGLVAAIIPAPLDHQCIRAQAAALQTLVTVARRAAGRGQEALSTLASVDDVLPLLGSLHANARRREDQGRYDTAALLRYRCLELISQHRLARRGILSEQPNFTLVLRETLDLEQQYERVNRSQGRRRFYGLPDRAFGLFVGYMLLAALDDELVRSYPIAQIEQRAEARNKSILAHGYRLITQEEYAQFARVVEDLLDRFFTVSGKDRQAWEQTFTFVELTYSTEQNA